MIAPYAAVFMLAACGSAPKPRPASASMSRPPADAPPQPVLSPDGSVRRARPEEISTGRAPLPGECEGDACSVVTVTWLDPGYRFENTSSRPVSIKIWFVAKTDCVRQEIAIAPGKNSGWGNIGFCKPYHVSYQ